MIVKTPSFVIKTSHYSETSLIVLLYTRDEGKIRCIAKGARRAKSQFAGKLETLNELEVVYSRGRSDLFTLTECSIIRSRMNIRNELSRLNAALKILALLDDTQADHDPNPVIYKLAASCLDYLNEEGDPEIILLFFYTRLLEALGYATDFGSCAICSLAVGKKPVYYAARNGFLCPKCSTNRKGMMITAGTIESLKKMQKSDFRMAARIRLSALQQKESESLFAAVFEAVLERRPISGKIFKEIEKG